MTWQWNDTIPITQSWQDSVFVNKFFGALNEREGVLTSTNSGVPWPGDAAPAGSINFFPLNTFFQSDGISLSYPNDVIGRGVNADFRSNKTVAIGDYAQGGDVLKLQLRVAFLMDCGFFVMPDFVPDASVSGYFTQTQIAPTSWANTFYDPGQFGPLGIFDGTLFPFPSGADFRAAAGHAGANSTKFRRKAPGTNGAILDSDNGDIPAGFIQGGDYIGHWLFEELRDLLNQLVCVYVRDDIPAIYIDPFFPLITWHQYGDIPVWGIVNDGDNIIRTGNYYDAAGSYGDVRSFATADFTHDATNGSRYIQKHSYRFDRTTTIGVGNSGAGLSASKGRISAYLPSLTRNCDLSIFNASWEDDPDPSQIVTTVPGHSDDFKRFKNFTVNFLTKVSGMSAVRSTGVVGDLDPPPWPSIDGQNYTLNQGYFRGIANFAVAGGFAFTGDT